MQKYDKFSSETKCSDLWRRNSCYFLKCVSKLFCLAFVFNILILVLFILNVPSFAHVEADEVAEKNNNKESNPEEAPPNLLPLENLANNWLKRHELQHSLVGLEIMHIPSAHILFSFNGSKRFVPASTTKVFTTACAMDTFGPQYRFCTSLKVYGKIEGDRIVGALYLQPSQDPSFKTHELQELLSVLHKKGIKTIEGNVGVVGIIGGGDRFMTGWLAEDWGQDWMPVSSDFVLDDNIARKDPGRGYPMQSYSASPGENALINSLLSGPTGPSWISFHPAGQIMQFWHPRGAAIGGQIVGNPNEYNLAALKNLLKKMGIKIKEKNVPLEVMEQTPFILAEHNSKPLSELVKHCLKESDNLYAQQFLRALGNLPVLNRSYEKANLEERGLDRLLRWSSALGINSTELVLWDGCGLSRKNCFTPHALNLVHRHMAGAHLASAYLDVMPLDGAINSGQSRGTFRYKTGAMDSVRSISGILFTAANEPLAVTVMVNDHSPSIRDVRASINSLIDHLQSLGSLRYKTQAVVPVKLKQTPSSNSTNKKKKKIKSAVKSTSNVKSHVHRKLNHKKRAK